MNHQKDTISSMKSFMEIFSIDEVKKFVEMRNERVMDQATSMILNDEKIKKMSEDLVKKTTDPIKKEYEKIIGEKYRELLELAFSVTIKIEKDKRKEFIQKHLSLNKHLILPLLEDYENKP